MCSLSIDPMNDRVVATAGNDARLLLFDTRQSVHGWYNILLLHTKSVIAALHEIHFFNIPNNNFGEVEQYTNTNSVIVWEIF